MDGAELSRIRHKVEQGERLTEAELQVLRDAAQAQPGPTLRLAIAHAMINAEDPRTALPLLERLVRDFPRDLQAWLGLARALMALERKQEAERALKEALSLSPGDPEATKVLAVLAMERGELERARQWVADVLRRDPFDSEAQLIKAELESAGEAPPPPNPEAAAPGAQNVALRPEFTRELLRALRARGVQAAVKDDELLVRPPGADAARVELGSLYAAYLAESRPLGESVRTLVDGLTAAALGVPTDLTARVLPVLRPASFAEVARGAVWTEGPAGLRIFYVIDDPELVRYVPRGSLPARGLDEATLSRAAFTHLEQRSVVPLAVRIIEGRLLSTPAPTGVYAVCAEDGHDAARLLTASQRAQLERVVGPGPWRVDLGRREAALVCRREDAGAAMQLDGLPAEDDGIAGRFVLHSDGRLEREERH